MAIITTQNLTIANLTATTVRATVTYRLIPNAVEKLAGSVFSENISGIGDDPGVATDIIVFTYPTVAFAVNPATVFVQRTRILTVAKAALNEDPGFEGTGAEQVDEIKARIHVTYAANPPLNPAPPPTTDTNIVTGAFK